MPAVAEIRRAAMADAVVAIVGARVRGCTVEDLARPLGLQQADIRAALERLRAKHTAPPAPRVVKAGGRRFEVIEGGASEKPAVKHKDRTGQTRDVVCDHPGCGKAFYDAQGLGVHQVVHRTKACRFCRRDINAKGIGSHELRCAENPDRIEPAPKAATS